MTHGSSTYDSPTNGFSSQSLIDFDIQMSVARDSAMAVLGCLLRNPHLIGRMPEYGLDLSTIDPELQAVAQAAADVFEEGEQHEAQTEMDTLPFVARRWNYARFGRDYENAYSLLFKMWDNPCSPQAMQRHVDAINAFNSQVATRQAYERFDRLRSSLRGFGKNELVQETEADQAACQS